MSGAARCACDWPLPVVGLAAPAGTDAAVLRRTVFTLSVGCPCCGRVWTNDLAPDETVDADSGVAASVVALGDRTKRS